MEKESELKKAADRVRAAVSELNSAMTNARSFGLRVDIDSVPIEYADRGRLDILTVAIYERL